MKKKRFRLVYEKDGTREILFRSENREEVEEKRLDLSFDYNTKFLKIEEYWVRIEDPASDIKINVDVDPITAFIIGGGILIISLFVLLTNKR